MPWPDFFRGKVRKVNEVPPSISDLDPRIYLADIRLQGDLIEPITVFVIENRGGSVAHDVQVRPIVLGGKNVTFTFLEHLAVNQRADVLIDRATVQSRKRDILSALDEEADAREKAEGGTSGSEVPPSDVPLPM